MNNTISDETIMAYVDGELDKEQSTLVRKALQNNPTLIKKADLFRETSSMLDGIYDAPLHEEVPAHLASTIDACQPGFSHRIWRFFHTFLPFPNIDPAFSGAIAASILIGVGLLYMARNPLAPRPAPNTLISSREFSNALEKTLGGQSRAIEKYGATITPVITFRNREHQFCRQYEVISESGANQIFQQGIACRDLTGQWETMTIITLQEDTSQHPGSAAFELSGAENVIDKTMDQLRAGSPLTPKEELERIRLNWKI